MGIFAVLTKSRGAKSGGAVLTLTSFAQTA